MQRVHGVNNQRRVSDVFAAGVAELLYGKDGHGVQHVFPAVSADVLKQLKQEIENAHD